ncbi:MAG: archease [Candidatus Omnitrophica bacterium]|nr:archease [Candidatus Omnitrophota bacterium]
MPYQYLEDVATADIAFEAWGETVEEMFKATADATMNVMVEDLNAIDSKEQKILSVEDDEIDLLLFQFLQELIFYKDAQDLLLRIEDLHIKKEDGRFSCLAEAYGEKLDAGKHALNVDIKAITLHRFEVKETLRGWEATVVLDI